MTWVVGVRFKPAGKIYHFDNDQLELEAGEAVIVETVRGIEYGLVAIGNREVDDEQLVLPLKKVLRKANQEDENVYQNNQKKEKDALEICKQKVKEHDLPMRLIDVEYTFDMGKIIFYFTSESRVDFRELVKDLAAIFKTRIELRQIGVRDEAKMLGGIGTCGRVLCCKQFLGEFEPVSIRMAKEQNLSLNPTKISGVCGRLMCCLKYESQMYDSKRPEGVKTDGENNSGIENADKGPDSGSRGSKGKGNKSGKGNES
ncbi:MAG: stage 0 sporulation family protein [Bacillota bacterium]|nr:stage 0 sporulation family protein [Bacillota bacterium]